MIRRSVIVMLSLAAVGGCMKKKPAPVAVFDSNPSTMPTTGIAETMPTTDPVVTVTPPMTMPTTTEAVLVPPPTIEPATTLPTTVAIEPTTRPATAELGTAGPTANLVKKKPFIAGFAARQTDPTRIPGGRPSTLLQEHASPASPVPLTQFASQPVHLLADFKLSPTLTPDELQHRLGGPAQVAGIEDPWLVYRLPDENELWLHFSPAEHGHLESADVIRGAEDGYVRTKVFPGK